MGNKFMQAVLLIIGVVLIFVGVVALVSPESTLLSIAFVLGLGLLVSGVGSILIYATMRDFSLGGGWMLADGIITTLLALFLLFNPIKTAAVIPYIFALWVMFSGILKLVHSFEVKKLEVSGWLGMLLLGMVGVLLGFAALFNPIAAMITISILIGIFLIFQGISAILLWLMTLKSE